MPKKTLYMRYYSRNEKCPCCSTERDRGGILILRILKRCNTRGNPEFYLKCPVCKYTISKKQTNENFTSPEERHNLISTMGL